MIKCVSWNILAQRFLKLEEMPPENNEVHYSWVKRREGIRCALLASEADLIFLQEVELVDLQEDFALILSHAWDHVEHTVSKKRTNPIGNVIFWRRSMLELTKQTSNSCSLYTEFDVIGTENKFFALNLHLKSGLKSKRQERTNQVNSCLKLVSPNLNGFISGDFNDDLDLDNGSTLRDLFQGWQIDSAGITCMNLSRHTGKFENWSFDHVVSKGIDVDLELTSSTYRMKETIPSSANPSDHYMISFSIKSK